MKPYRPKPPPPGQSSPSNPFHHHHDAGGTCANCGSPTSFPPPPPSDNPTYIPIRAPAVNLPPTNTKETIIRTPVPQSQPVVPLSPPYTFQRPIKKIQTQNDVVRFHSSPTSANFIGFVVALSESIRSHKLSDPCHVSDAVSSVVSVLETLNVYVDEIPLAPQSSRYGNVAYRTWHERMCCDAKSFMLKFLPADLSSATIELVPYFTDSFGNSSRIDYGTGHETNFAAWLYCLSRLGVVKEEDYQALVSRVFIKYLELMRKLQLTYSLEPAGSHGVWGLDDYHFLPFIFGSSQLIDHKYMKPKSIHNDDILENFSNEYLYLSCIIFIKKVKKGLFAEHSPMLDDISGVPHWSKVNSGLLKMYKGISMRVSLYFDVDQSCTVLIYQELGQKCITFWQYIAVLAGDFLLSQACVALAFLKNTEVVSLLATVVEHLVTGEIMQMTTSSDEHPSMEHYMQKTYYKMASLISSSCKAIALLTGHTA